MLSAMLIVFSITALAQFALYYWRAILAGVAAQPVSERVFAAAGLHQNRVTSRDFDTLAGLHALTPELHPGQNSLGFVPVYYRLVEWIGARAGQHFPAMAEWSERERTVCALYTAVLVDRRLHENLALAASLRSC